MTYCWLLIALRSVRLAIEYAIIAIQSCRMRATLLFRLLPTGSQVNHDEDSISIHFSPMKS